MRFLSPWHRAIAAIAVAKVAIALGLYAASFAAPDVAASAREIRFAAFIACFAAASALLLTAGSRDLRATVLGIAFALIAAVFSDTALTLPAARGTASGAIQLLFALQVDAFTGYFLWYFAQEFPRAVPFGPRRRVPELGMRVTLAVGVFLFAVNLLGHFTGDDGRLGRLLGAFSRQQPNGLYWPIQYALALAGLGVVVWKSRGVAPTDRRRVALLIGGLVVGTAPSIAWTFLATASPEFRRLVPLSTAAWIVYPTLLATPLLTTYSVLVHQALNVRLIIRRAIQYALARYTVLVIAAVPVALLVVQVYRHRDQPVSSIVGGSTGLLLGALAILAALAARGRRGVMDRIDRRFFREQYDARLILHELSASLSADSTRRQIADRVRAGVERALHPEKADVLLLSEDSRQFVSPAGLTPPVDVESALGRLLASSSATSVDLSDDHGPLTALPEEARSWLADANARLVLPLRAGDDKVLGLIVLADKKSELPYSSEDVRTLTTVAATAGMAMSTLSHSVESGRPMPRAPGMGAGAAACVRCGQVEPGEADACRRCGSPVAPLPVPALLSGKFRLLERIGEGGMGVVFRGVDVSLDRPVAIKTLPRMSPVRATRLRREARTMAAISHPHLATIYAVESWNGLPILIVEYLPGDSIAARLAERGPLPRHEALELGVALADVAHALHSAAILHRDIKPANVAYAADGTPKLLDFGLARLLERAVVHTTDRPPRLDPALLRSARFDHLDATTSLTIEGQLVGTPAYLSPEAVAGDDPDPSFDLWSISVVLFEALSGVNPARAPSVSKTLERIERGELAGLADVMPDADPELAAFFARALAHQRDRRIPSAAALREELLRLLAYSTSAR